MNFKDPNFVIRACKCSMQEDVVLCFYRGKDKVVRIPDGVTMIADYAFGSEAEPNTTIQKIIMPDTIESLEPNALSYCQALTDITFSKGLKSLDISLEGCISLTELSIPKNIETIKSIKRERSLVTINVNDNLTEVEATAFNFTTSCTHDYRGYKLTYGKWYQQETIRVLQENPAYKIIGGFMVNTKKKATLFRTDFSNSSDVHIPEDIECIGTGTFDESRLRYAKNKGLRVKKLTIPASVKTIEFFAFKGCTLLNEVIYKGTHADVEIDEMAFFDCKFMKDNGSNIIFSDEPTLLIDDSKLSNMKLERLVFIHHCFQQGRYMNKNQLQDEMMRHFGLAKLGISTITRDIEFLRDRFNAPIEYDFFHKGYYYTEEFELTL